MVSQGCGIWVQAAGFKCMRLPWSDVPSLCSIRRQAGSVNNRGADYMNLVRRPYKQRISN